MENRTSIIFSNHRITPFINTIHRIEYIQYKFYTTLRVSEKQTVRLTSLIHLEGTMDKTLAAPSCTYTLTTMITLGFYIQA